MKIKRTHGLLAVLLAVAMVAFPAVNTNAAEGGYSDVNVGDWYYEQVTDLSADGVIKGFSDGTYRPGESIKRAHIAKLIVETAGLEMDGAVVKFTDIGHLAASEQEYINILASNGIIKGYSNSTIYRPQDPVTRSQLAKIIVKAFGLRMGSARVEFDDVKGLDAETQTYINILASNGIVSGYGGTKLFGPNDPVTRGQIAKIISRILDEEELVIVHTNDVHGHVEADDTHIGYANYKNVIDAVEAANKHVLVIDAGDASQGSNFASLNEGADVITVLNMLPVDAFAPGNHEFDYSKESALANYAASDFKWYASNVFYEESGELVFDGGEVLDVNGLKVGVFGLATPETKYKADPRNTAGLIFSDTVAANAAIAQAEVDKLEAAGG